MCGGFGLCLLSEVVAPCSVAGAGHAAASAVDAHKLEPQARGGYVWGSTSHRPLHRLQKRLEKSGQRVRRSTLALGGAWPKHSASSCAMSHTIVLTEVVLEATRKFDPYLKLTEVWRCGVLSHAHVHALLNRRQTGPAARTVPLRCERGRK